MRNDKIEQGDKDWSTSENVIKCLGAVQDQHWKMSNIIMHQHVCFKQ